MLPETTRSRKRSDSSVCREGIIPIVTQKSPTTSSATFRRTRRGKEYSYERHEKTIQKESLVLETTQEDCAAYRGKYFLEPEWKIAGQITFKSGKKSYFRYNALDLNPVGASDTAKDKDYANLFIQRLGYPVVPDSKTFFSKNGRKPLGLTAERLTMRMCMQNASVFRLW